MGTIHPDCQKIADEIKLLQQELIALSDDLNHAAPGQKPAIAAQIKKLNSQISAKRKLYNLCMANHTVLAPVTSILSGNVSIWFGPGGYSAPATPTITFSGYNHADAELLFPDVLFEDAIHFTSILGNGGADFIIRLVGGKATGTYDSNSHNLSIPLTFKFIPTSITGFLSFLIKIDPSELPLRSPGLTTRNVTSHLTPAGSISGSPLNTSPGQDYGKIKLVGSGIATDGIAKGREFVIELSGTLNPVP
jgi:hypothetical protein